MLDGRERDPVRAADYRGTNMRKIALGIATATAIVASPAVARDDQWYAGPELGVIWPVRRTS